MVVIKKDWGLAKSEKFKNFSKCQLKTLQAWNYPLPRRESTLVKNADKPRLEPDCRYFWHLLEQIDSVEP
jgi:hypothetical protein